MASNKFAIFTANATLVANIKELLCHPRVLVSPSSCCDSGDKHDMTVLPGNIQVEVRVANVKRICFHRFFSVV
jgi:hypothetical protein